MRYMRESCAVIGAVLLLPVYLNAQQAPASSPEFGAPQARPEAAQREPESGQTMISVESLVDSKVFDRDNKEIGTVKALMLDPTTGKLVRADIALGGRGFLGIRTGEQRVSVPWEQVSVKRHEGNLVVVMDREIVEKIRTQQTKQTEQKQQETASGAKATGASREAQPLVPESKQQQPPPAGAHQQATASPDEIKKAQEALKEKGLNPGPIDGTMNSQTQQAIREFQKQNNLTITGSLDQQTAEKLGVRLTAGRGQPGVEAPAPQTKDYSAPKN